MIRGDGNTDRKKLNPMNQACEFPYVIKISALDTNAFVMITYLPNKSNEKTFYQSHGNHHIELMLA